MTVAHTLATSYISQNMLQAGSAAAAKSVRKMTKYSTVSASYVFSGGGRDSWSLIRRGCRSVDIIVSVSDDRAGAVCPCTLLALTDLAIISPVKCECWLMAGCCTVVVISVSSLTAAFPACEVPRSVDVAGQSDFLLDESVAVSHVYTAVVSSGACWLLGNML